MSYSHLAHPMMRAIFDEVESKVSLTFGTLLWLWRDGCTNPKPTDDEDLAVLEEHRDAVLEAIPRIFETYGYKVAAKYFYEDEMTEIKLGYDDQDKTQYIDIFFLQKKDEYRRFFTVGAGNVYIPHRIKASYFEDTVPFLPEVSDELNVPWQIPFDTEGFLYDHYGPNWRVHNPNWSYQVDPYSIEPEWVRPKK